MEQKKFSPKDARLIRDNPGKSPEELLALGLSKAAYNRLPANKEETPAEKLQPVKIEAANAPGNMPNGRQPNHVVRLHNKLNGVVQKVGYRAASFLVSYNPRKFEIL